MEITKRTFLKTVGTGIPTVRMMLQAQTSGVQASSATRIKFTPIDCTGYFNASRADLATWQIARGRSIRTPAGSRNFRGIPFSFAADGGRQAYLLLSRRSGAAESVEIPLGRQGGFLCLAQFCDWDQNENGPTDIDAFEKVGQHLADAILIYEDGSTHVSPIRRRFEVNSLSHPWGHLCFGALPHREDTAVKLNQPLRNAQDWGDLQTGVWQGVYGGSDDGVSGTLWLYALENPSPTRTIKSLRLEAKSDDALVVCGLTVCHGGDNPLRRERLSLYRITLPEVGAPDAWQATVDLGIIARTYQLPLFEPEAWVKSPATGTAEPARPVEPKHLYIELSAASSATMTLRNTRTGAQYDFDLSRVQPDRELEGAPGGARIQVLEREKVWLHGRVLDGSTGRPTPVRLAFRSNEGRYIPPFGHRTEINSAWFQDYGADIRMGGSSFAYVDGTFQIELPVGDVYVEILKGFEYEPIRKKVQIRADQRELDFQMSPFAGLRAKNWVSADTHVHFLSPTTAILEGQAEGLNLINVLAAQWGDLFTNVGDLYHNPLTSHDGDMMVWVGSENRQHVLGHIALLGGHGAPIFPMSASGPSESYIGDPLWESLAGWADASHKRDGLAVSVHFPYPTAEVAADIALGKIDAVELWPTGMNEQFNTLRFLDWYRYLNCGYRLPAVSGTDKMGAWIAAGTYRAYAYLGQDQFSFANWAKAVRRGNTFMTSGPLIFLHVDGQAPGDEIRLGAGGGKVEARVEVKSTVPIHRLEIILNGRVVASREDKDGTRDMQLHEAIPVSGPGWVAARCASRFSSGSARVAAHTSPVYLTVPGQELFSAPTAAYMLTLIDGAETWVKKLAIHPDRERLQRVLGVLTEARNRLHLRMHQHGIHH
jgi:hypothetical protein